MRQRSLGDWLTHTDIERHAGSMLIMFGHSLLDESGLTAHAGATYAFHAQEQRGFEFTLYTYVLYYCRTKWHSTGFVLEHPTGDSGTADSACELAKAEQREGETGDVGIKIMTLWRVHDLSVLHMVSRQTISEPVMIDINDYWWSGVLLLLLYFETITKRSVRIGNFLRIKRHKSRYDKCAYIVIIVVLYIFNNASGLFHVHFIYVSLTRHALKGCYLLQNVIA